MERESQDRQYAAHIEAIQICRDKGVLIHYLREREKEVIDIMIMLFDQEYAVEQFGRSQRKEGIAEGEIRGVIKFCHDEMNLAPAEIIRKIMVRFHLNQEEAEKYVEETLGLQLA